MKSKFWRKTQASGPVRLKAKSYVMTPGDVAPVEKCEAAAIFVSHPRSPPNPGMWHGIFVHRFLEYCQTKGHAAALAYVKKKSQGAYNVCKSLDMKLLPQGDPEVEMLIDARAGTADTATYRDADVDHHIVLRTDITWLGEDGFPNLADYKTGDRVYDPHLDDQFSIGATALWMLRDRCDGVWSHAINITTGLPRWRSHLFERVELEASERRLKRAHARMRVIRQEVHEEGVTASFTSGKHCSSCRARWACPHAPKEATEYKPAKKGKIA